MPASQVEIVGERIVRLATRDERLSFRGHVNMNLTRNCRTELALQSEDAREFAVEGGSPEWRRIIPAWREEEGA